MSADLEVHRPAALAIRPGQEMWTDKQKAALAVLGIRNATNGDLAVFMHYCQKTGLDPFSKQIYMIARREKQGGQWVDKQTIQVGIEGFRVIRDRAARRDRVDVEYEDTRWYDADGIAYEIWLRDEPPAGCGMAVLKNGKRFPAVLTYAEYVQATDGVPTGKWKTAPAHQLEKCAEAFALRRAFPHDLGGIYIEEEMPATDPAGPAVPQRPLRVTADEITGNGHSPEPPVTEEEQPRERGPQRAGKVALAKMDSLLRSLQLGPDEDVNALLEWQCGEPFAGTRSHVAQVTGFLEDHLAACQGDTAEAASAIWAQYRAVTEQDAAEAGDGDG